MVYGSSITSTNNTIAYVFNMPKDSSGHFMFCASKSLRWGETTHLAGFTPKSVKETIANAFAGLPQYRYTSLQPYNGLFLKRSSKRIGKRGKFLDHYTSDPHMYGTGVKFAVMPECIVLIYCPDPTIFNSNFVETYI